VDKRGDTLDIPADAVEVKGGETAPSGGIGA
jgi:hypothetical protein